MAAPEGKNHMFLALEPPGPVTPGVIQDVAGSTSARMETPPAARTRTRQGLCEGGKRLGLRPKADGIIKWLGRLLGHSGITRRHLPSSVIRLTGRRLPRLVIRLEFKKLSQNQNIFLINST